MIIEDENIIEETAVDEAEVTDWPEEPEDEFDEAETEEDEDEAENEPDEIEVEPEAIEPEPQKPPKAKKRKKPKKKKPVAIRYYSFPVLALNGDYSSEELLVATYIGMMGGYQVDTTLRWMAEFYGYKRFRDDSAISKTLKTGLTRLLQRQAIQGGPFSRIKVRDHLSIRPNMSHMLFDESKGQHLRITEEQIAKIGSAKGVLKENLFVAYLVIRRNSKWSTDALTQTTSKILGYSINLAAFRALRRKLWELGLVEMHIPTGTEGFKIPIELIGKYSAKELMFISFFKIMEKNRPEMYFCIKQVAAWLGYKISRQNMKNVALVKEMITELRRQGIIEFSGDIETATKADRFKVHLFRQHELFRDTDHKRVLITEEDVKIMQKINVRYRDRLFGALIALRTREGRGVERALPYYEKMGCGTRKSLEICALYLEDAGLVRLPGYSQRIGENEAEENEEN